MNETRKGELFSLAGVVMWSFFPVITTLSYSNVPALISLAWSSLFASIFFGCVVAYKNLWHELTRPLFWKYIAGVTFFTGILVYGLYYTGLEYTTPGDASIIMIFEVVATYLLFNVFRREEFSREHTLGAMLISVGALIVLGKNFTGISGGDFFVLAAACAAPMGNLFQRKARAIASSETIMFVRSLIAAAVIFVLAYALGKHSSWGSVHASLIFLLVNGVLLLGLSKIFFIEAIHRIPVTKAIAFGSASPVLTLLIAWALLGQRPDLWQLVSLVPVIGGVLLLTNYVSLGTFSNAWRK